MSSEPDLSVVVPVRDAVGTLRPLVESLLAIRETEVSVLLIDDGSHDGSSELVRALATEHDEVTALFHGVSRGAGVARNEAFAMATGRYSLFFDADDIVHADAVAHALVLLEESDADLAFMPYQLRGSTADSTSMHPPDLAIWESSLGYGHHRVAPLREVPDLLGFTNYPWNKILRTSTYRASGLRFGVTPVHNDVLGHWHALLHARQILLLDEVICTHVVTASGRNLTNRQSQVRLHLFDALDETLDLLESRPDDRQRYARQYWAFAVRTSNWAGDRIGPRFRDEFQRRLREHLLRIKLADFASLRMELDPRLAKGLVRKALH